MWPFHALALGNFLLLRLRIRVKLPGMAMEGANDCPMERCACLGYAGGNDKLMV